jgi:hypothetical protein
MATWQADFRLVFPRSLARDHRKQLSAILPPGKSWSPDLETWGVEDSHRVDIWHRNGQPQEGNLRLDVRSPDPALFERILSWVRGNGVELQDEAGRTVEPNIGELSLALRGSKAFRFVENPALYLRRLKLGGLDDA